MVERRLGSFDLDTGEVVEGVAVWVGRRVKSPYGRQWMAINQGFMEEFSARRDIGLEEWRIFGYLNSRLDFDNLIQVAQVEIAEALGMQRSNVNRAMKRLEDLGIILRGPKVGRSCTYRLNPNAGWKGKTVNLNRAMAQHLKLVRENERDPNTQDMFTGEIG